MDTADFSGAFLTLIAAVVGLLVLSAFMEIVTWAQEDDDEDIERRRLDAVRGRRTR